MATADDLKKQQELNKALEEENEILRKRNKLQSDGYDMSSSLVESLKEVLGIRSRHSTFEQDILNTNKEINKSILSQKSGLQDLQSTKIQIRKNNDLISKASTLQLGLEKSIGKEGVKRSENYVERLLYQKQLEDAIEEENKKLQKGDLVAEKQLQASKNYLAIVEEQNLKQFGNLSNLQKQYAISVLNTAELKKQTQERKKDKEMLLKLQASMGIAGALVKTLGSIPGLGDAAAKAFEDVERKLKADAEATGKVASRWKTFGMLVSETGKHLKQALTDPAVILTKIYTAFLAVNKESVELSRLSGQNGDVMAGANFALADTVDFLKVAGELTKQMGLNAQNVFSADVMAGAAELKNTMGLSAEEAGGLALMAQTGGKDIKDMSTSMVSVVSSFNKSNKSAVSQGVALRDAANASDSMKLSLGNSGTALAKAASSAARLGLTLKDLDSISDSLVDFQSSISNELEAELLIGKDLNLEKARELALSNDIAGVGNEIFKNSSSISEFGKMNRIQQEAYAKALGVSKDQLAKMAYNKALQLGMSEEEAAKAAKVEASDMRRMEIQEKMAKVMDKIFQAFSPILDVLELIIDPLAKMLAIVGGVVGYTVKLLDKMHLLKVPVLLIVGAFAASKVASFFGTAVKGTKDLLASTKELLSGGLIDKLKTFGSGLGDAFNKAKGGGATETLADKAKDKVGGAIEDKVGGLADKVLGVEEQVPVDSGSKLNVILKAVEKIKARDLVVGAGALAIAAGAMWVLGKAMQEFKDIGLETYLGAGAALLGLTLALVGLAAVGPAVLLGAGALIVAAGAVYILGKALQEVGKAMNIMTPALTVLDNLGSKADALATVKGSLMGIADGLREIADAGTGAIPVLDKLNTLGGSKSAGEAKGKADEGSLSAVAAKLDTLIAVVKAGGDVYLDSNKVGRALVLAGVKS